MTGTVPFLYIWYLSEKYKYSELFSPVEGEELAVVEGLEGAKDYILGMKDLVIATDH